MSNHRFPMVFQPLLSASKPGPWGPSLPGLAIAIESAQQMDLVPQRDAGTAGAAEGGAEGRQPGVVLGGRPLNDGDGDCGRKMRMNEWVIYHEKE